MWVDDDLSLFVAAQILAFYVDAVSELLVIEVVHGERMILKYLRD